MSELVLNQRTTLSGEEVIVRAVQYFTSARWRAQTQSARVVTFVGRPRIPISYILLTLFAFTLLIVPGIIMYLFMIRRLLQMQNIVVTANPLADGTEVIVTSTKAARKAVSGFLAALPPADRSAAQSAIHAT